MKARCLLILLLAAGAARADEGMWLLNQPPRELLNKSENERSGVFSTAMSFLSLYRDPVVATNTERSEFSVSDLMNHERPVSLYLVVPPSFPPLPPMPPDEGKKG